MFSQGHGQGHSPRRHHRMILQHDNARYHVTNITKVTVEKLSFLTENSLLAIPNLRYSAGPAPSAFHPFSFRLISFFHKSARKYLLSSKIFIHKTAKAVSLIITSNNHS